jgi:hypothetical protein
MINSHHEIKKHERQYILNNFFMALCLKRLYQVLSL